MGSDINFFEAKVECPSYDNILIIKLEYIDWSGPYINKIFWESSPHKVIGKKRLRKIVGCQDAKGTLEFVLKQNNIPLKHEYGFCPAGHGIGSWGRKPKRDTSP